MSATDLENTLYLDVPAGRVVIALRPDLAPGHVAPIVARHEEALGLQLRLQAQELLEQRPLPGPPAKRPERRPRGTAPSRRR